MRTRIYLAGPLFSQAEIDWASRLKEQIERSLGDGVEVIWPHEIASGPGDVIFKINRSALEGCPLMVAILDGSQVDDGTAWELGFHHALFGKAAIGIRTDCRKAGESKDVRVNLMIEHSCRSIVKHVGELVEELERALEEP